MALFPSDVPNPFYLGWFNLVPMVLGPIIFLFALFVFVQDSLAIEWPQPIGCKQIGLKQPSNLLDEADPRHSGTGASEKAKTFVKALWIFPIKSCMPVELSEGTVVKTGLKYDRQFSFAQLVTSRPEKQADGSEKTTRQWKFITQRECPRLALVKTELWVPDHSNHSYKPEREVIKNGGCIIVSFPFTPDLSFSIQGFKDLINSLGAKYRAGSWAAESTVAFEVPFLPTVERMEAKQYPPMENMMIWKENPEAINMCKEIPRDVLDKLRYVLGLSNPLTLFRVDSTNYREVYRCAPKKEEVGYQPVTGFADAFPLSIMGIPSVQDVASRLPGEHGKDLKAIRFRANIYVTGGRPYSEDDWKRVRIGGHEYHVTNRLTRCKMPNVDPDTGVADQNQPYVSMAKHRCIDEGAGNKPCLGMHVVPSTAEDREIRVGDEVEVLETGPHFYIKQ